MKKIMMMVALVAMTMTVSAQSLDGNWQAEKLMEDVKMDYILTFEGNQMSQRLVCTCEQEIGTVSIEFAVPAQSYTPESKTLNFAFDASMTEVKLKEVKFNEQTKAVIKEKPSWEDFFKKLVLEDFEEKKEKIANQFLFSGECTITKQTAQSFELNGSNGETYVFKKAAITSQTK